MANSMTTITSSYGGEGALPYIAPAILSADSIANGYITVKENVKKSLALKKLDGSEIKAYACDFNATADTLTLSEAVLTPTELMQNIELCKSDYRDDFEAMATGRGFINSQIPPNFQSFLLLYLAERVSEAIEKNIWHGNYNETTGATTGGSAVTNFGGILAAIVAGTPGDETEVAGAFTGDDAAATGILTHLDSLCTGAPNSIQGDARTVVYMSRKSLYLLQRAMSGFVTTSGGISPTFAGEARPMTYMGYNIIVPNGFPNDTLVIGQVANFYFGTDLVSDFNQAVVVDMTETDASDNVRIRMQFTGATQVAFLGDVGVVRRTS